MLDVKRIETRVKVYHLKTILASEASEGSKFSHRRSEVTAAKSKKASDDTDWKSGYGIDTQSSSPILKNLEKFEYKKNYYYKLFKASLALNQNHEARRALAMVHIFSKKIDAIYMDIQKNK